MQIPCSSIPQVIQSHVPMMTLKCYYMDTVFAEQPMKVKKGKQGKSTRMKTTPF
jgi:hypothetical protein